MENFQNNLANLSSLELQNYIKKILRLDIVGLNPTLPHKYLYYEIDSDLILKSLIKDISIQKLRDSIINSLSELLKTLSRSNEIEFERYFFYLLRSIAILKPLDCTISLRKLLISEYYINDRYKDNQIHFEIIKCLSKFENDDFLYNYIQKKYLFNKKVEIELSYILLNIITNRLDKSLFSFVPHIAHHLDNKEFYSLFRIQFHFLINKIGIDDALASYLDITNSLELNHQFDAIKKYSFLLYDEIKDLIQKESLLKNFIEFISLLNNTRTNNFNKFDIDIKRNKKEIPFENIFHFNPDQLIFSDLQLFNPKDRGLRINMLYQIYFFNPDKDTILFLLSLLQKHQVSDLLISNYHGN